jgi:hypothetical protein
MVVGRLSLWLVLASTLVVAVGGLTAFQAHAAPMALIVLDTSKVAPARTAAPQIPSGWQLKVNTGLPDITVSDQDTETALHFRSMKSSYALERAVDIDPTQLPYLNWRWKVTQLPKGGDFRRSSADDQAAQVLVAFDDRHIITYIWDSTAPQGTMENASSIPFVHISAVVMRSGTADINQWLQETRNVALDYQKAFGKTATHIKGLRLQINSQHTGSSAESFFGQVIFRNAQS